MTYYLMSTGVPLIYNPVLKYEEFLGRPDLLVKMKGKSRFGSHHYVPCSIKIGKKLKEEYKFHLMYYSYLLSIIQGVYPSTASIINAEKKDIAFKTNEDKKKFEKVVEHMKSICLDKEKVEPSLISECKECVWQKHCLEQLKKKKDLSLVYGLGTEDRVLLEKRDVKNIKDLSKIDVPRVGKLKGFNEKKLKQWALQAKSLLTDEPIVLKEVEFNKAETEVFFDIECDSSQGVNYLFGALVREKGKRAKYMEFWSDNAEQEEEKFREFCKFIDGLKRIKIYHYSTFERTMLKKLLKKYKISKKISEKITKNLVDLFPLVTKSVVLPVSSYTLKDIADFMGFEWKNEKSSGGQSVYWYSLWQEENDEKYKKLLLEYNMNDCEALKDIKEWLEKQKLN